LFDYFDRDPIHIEALLGFTIDGDVELAITTRVMSDTKDKWSKPSPIWVKIQSIPVLKTIGTGIRWNTSRWDSGDSFLSEEGVRVINRIREIMSDAQLNDIDHLLGHVMGERDIFVTSDHHFLDHKEQLSREIGVTILRPEDAVTAIKESLA
jgi:hypothetical protein